MLQRHGELIRTGLLITDLALVAASWLGAYALRFHTDWFPAPPGGRIPPFEQYAMVLALILPLWFLLFRERGLYAPQRTGSVVREITNVVRATATGVLLLVGVTFFLRSYYYSRLVIGIFALLSLASVATVRTSGRILLHELRRRGLNLRYLLVVGGGELAGEVIERIRRHPATGLRVVGLVAERPAAGARELHGVPVLGGIAQLKSVLARERADQVVVALSRDESHQLEKVLADLDDELVTVRMVPDLRHILTLRSTVEDFEGLPVIGLRESPIVGLAALRKRAFDVAVSAALLALLSPLLAAIALAVRATSGRPVLYRQERMGLDGRVFQMLKFRTMAPDAERQTGPVWSGRDDARRTRIGAWLRRFSLDELPQLWNVLRGDMSLVGPRPERPVFVQQFRREIPGYVLRLKVKAGMTGWAQVHGWRGDTSLHERIEHDIDYIQNWSLALDVRILLRTLGRSLFDRNAH